MAVNTPIQLVIIPSAAKPGLYRPIRVLAPDQFREAAFTSEDIDGMLAKLNPDDSVLWDCREAA